MNTARVALVVVMGVVAIAAVVGYVVVAIASGAGEAPEVLLGVATTALGLLAPSPVK